MWKFAFAKKVKDSVVHKCKNKARGLKRMYYKEYGNKEGQLVVFIHGGFTTNESFAKQYQLLPDKRMIFVDLPGCGKSECAGRKKFSFDDSAVEIIKLIKQLSPEGKAILIAHSYGGLVVKEIIQRRPELIDKIVVGSTNVKKSLLFWLYTRKTGCHILWKQNKERYMHDGTTWRCICDMQKDAWTKFSLSSMKTNKEIKSLFLVAEKDIKEIRESMNLWEKKFPDHESYTVKNSGHNYFTDFPEIVNPIIIQFLKGKNWNK